MQTYINQPHCWFLCMSALVYVEWQAVVELLDKGASPDAVKLALCSLLSLSPDQVHLPATSALL